MKRFIRFEDVYLAHFDIYGSPQWVPRSEARNFFTRTMARNALKKAREYMGKDREIRIVIVGAPNETPEVSGLPSRRYEGGIESMTSTCMNAKNCGDCWTMQAMDRERERADRAEARVRELEALALRMHDFAELVWDQLVPIVEMDNEANDPSTDIYIALMKVKLAQDEGFGIKRTTDSVSMAKENK